MTVPPLAANVVLALSLALAGILLVRNRPRNPIGWLLLAGGVAHGIVAATGYWKASWIAGVAVPLALLLFPFGRLRSRVWRPALAIFAPVLIAVYLTAPYAGIGIATVAVVGSLATRYHQGDEVVRRQVLWLVLGLTGSAAALLPGRLLGNDTLLVLAIPLLPASITIAILRYRLIDVRLVLSRSVLYLLLVGAALGVFALWDSALVLVVAMLAVEPVRTRLQPGFDRVFGVTRQDAVRTFPSDLTSLDTLLTAVREALQLPFAAFRLMGRDVAVAGSAAGPLEVITLATSGTAKGEFVISTRPGQRRLSAQDLQVLTVLAIPLGVALRATLLAEELQASRGRIVAAREEERRRLRRDLHDGLGPMLSGIAYAVDAARNRVGSTGETRELLDRLREEIGRAIVEIRRVVDGLRPPALDELGLTDAIRGAAERLSHRAGGHPVEVTVDTAGGVPELPAAVEVAAFRIVTEALTNVVKHSDATTVRVQLSVSDDLHIQVVDDGTPGPDGWVPGVGLASMAERAAEVGGRCLATPTSRGGRVEAVLPLG